MYEKKTMEEQNKKIVEKKNTIKGRRKEKNKEQKSILEKKKISKKIPYLQEPIFH